MVSFASADDEHHTYVMNSVSGCDLYVTLIPHDHLTTVSQAEGLSGSANYRHMLGIEDADLGECMTLLSRGVIFEADEVAHRLVLALSNSTAAGSLTGVTMGACSKEEPC
jgi:hypothetical protein